MVMNEVFVLSFLYALRVRVAKQVRENFVCILRDAQATHEE